MASEPDIVERLRQMGTHYGGSGAAVADEAAAEIVRLRAELQRLRGGIRRAIRWADEHCQDGGGTGRYVEGVACLVDDLEAVLRPHNDSLCADEVQRGE